MLKNNKLLKDFSKKKCNRSIQGKKQRSESIRVCCCMDLKTWVLPLMAVMKESIGFSGGGHTGDDIVHILGENLREWQQVMGMLQLVYM